MPLEALKNLHLTVPKTDQKHVDVYAFFMCTAVQTHKKIPKGPKFFNSQVSYQNKMCMFYFIFLAG